MNCIFYSLFMLKWVCVVGGMESHLYHRQKAHNRVWSCSFSEVFVIKGGPCSERTSTSEKPVVCHIFISCRAEAKVNKDTPSKKKASWLDLEPMDYNATFAFVSWSWKFGSWKWPWYTFLLAGWELLPRRALLLALHPWTFASRHGSGRLRRKQEVVLMAAVSQGKGVESSHQEGIKKSKQILEN